PHCIQLASLALFLSLTRAVPQVSFLLPLSSLGESGIDRNIQLIVVHLNVLFFFYSSAENSMRKATIHQDIIQPEAVNKSLVKVNTRGNGISAFVKARRHRKLQRKIFPDSALFRQWGDNLTNAQQIQAFMLFSLYGYNVYFNTRSLRCLEKKYPPRLPTLSVVITFMDEALSILQWAITSIIHRTPSHLLKELILVDDFSSNEDLKADLDKEIQLYNLKHPGLLTLIRHTERKGIASTRHSGNTVGLTHLARIQEDHTVIVSPIIDNILFDTLEVDEYPLMSIGFNWRLYGRYDYQSVSLKDDTVPIKSPAVMGIFAASRLFLEKIGFLDTGMLFYGGENVELSLRAWQCGGRIEILPCSQIAHLQRAHKPYSLIISPLMKPNALRVAEIWMDKHKCMVYLAWNLPLENHGIDFGEVSSRIELCKKLKCNSFEWYLKNIYPNLMPLQNIVGYGAMKNSVNEKICMDQGNIQENTPAMYNCNGFRQQFVYYHLTGELYVGQLYAETYSSDLCLADPGEGWKSELVSCQEATVKRLNMYWDFKQGASITNRDTNRCLEVSKRSSGSHILILQKCTGQRWTIQHTVRNWGVSRKTNSCHR
uniref:Polypeptide N-acetylgalactosaminyltransferase n=1 Tax=Vombatus ursinus TaxID=29139 RepID=A0A4X2KCV2_VOMUR